MYISVRNRWDLIEFRRQTYHAKSLDIYFSIAPRDPKMHPTLKRKGNSLRKKQENLNHAFWGYIYIYAIELSFFSRSVITDSHLI